VGAWKKSENDRGGVDGGCPDAAKGSAGILTSVLSVRLVLVPRRDAGRSGVLIPVVVLTQAAGDVTAARGTTAMSLRLV